VIYRPLRPCSRTPNRAQAAHRRSKSAKVH
jgi:hypothetical protein